jgi:hypothetical protein
LIVVNPRGCARQYCGPATLIFAMHKNPAAKLAPFDRPIGPYSDFVDGMADRTAYFYLI